MDLRTYRNRDESVSARDLVPQSEVEAMDEAMAERINAIVGPDDTLFCLGDFSMHGKAAELAQWRSMVNCNTIHLIKGNHDDWKPLKEAGFETVRDARSISHRANKVSTKFELCHYPFLSWNNMHKGSIHLHGHCHGSSEVFNVGFKRFDVGIDAREIDVALGIDPQGPFHGPWSFTQIAQAAETRTHFPAVDHHTPGNCD